MGKAIINESVYRYNGFLIRYSIEIIENRAVDIMRAIKEINHKGEKKNINFETIGDSFEEAKGEICNKINVYNSVISFEQKSPVIYKTSFEFSKRATVKMTC